MRIAESTPGANASPPISVIFEGASNVTELRDMQELKQHRPRFVTDDGISTAHILVPQNALSPIVAKVEGDSKVINSSEEH
jgi:hypothetical protein